MGSLLLIILILFAVLALVVKVTEKHAKPLDNVQQSKISGIIIILILVMLVGRLIQHLVGG
ncbi:MAG: hypothetical protein V3T17_06935 [Pseudomonadales bacterium]